VKQVYFCTDGQIVEGPVAADHLFERLLANSLPRDTNVCIEGTDKWNSFGDIILSLMGLPGHLDTIRGLLEAREETDRQHALLETSSTGALIGKAFAGSAGDLHSDMFGNLYSGNSHFSVGKLEHAPAHAGAISADSLGNVFSGHSKLPVGHTDKAPSDAGVLHNDMFGHIRSGDSQFTIGELGDPHGHPF